MVEQSFLSGQFLIAMPSLRDPNFAQSVTYICEHNQDGALGLVINRPTSVTLGELLEHMGQSEVAIPTVRSTPILFGGPVQTDRGFVLHSPCGGWEASLPVTEEVALSTSRDILLAMARGEGPTKAMIALGYAGWGAGQLEREMVDNAWLSGPADMNIVFDVPMQMRWEAAAASLGVELTMLSGDVGHA